MPVTRQDGTVEFTGAVLTDAWTGSRFVCSDYGLELLAQVWTGSEVKTINVGIIDVPGNGHRDVVVKDATPETLAAVEAWRTDQAERRRLETLAADLLADWTRVRQGDAVVVVKGRKVALGTRGVVRWIGSGTWGERVGLVVPGTDGLVYTAASNVKRDHSPEAKAAEVDAAHDSALWRDANVEAPKATLAASGLSKGDKVTPKAGRYAGRRCRVIWTGTRNGEARVGVVPATKGRFDADWLPLADADGGEVVNWQALRGRVA